MRYVASMAPRHPLALLLLATCQPSPANSSGFASTPERTTTLASTGDASTSSGTTGTSTGEPGNNTSTTDTSTEPLRDLGVTPDFGDDTPLGCKGKIDFLFVISRHGHMESRQQQLALAFPQFIATIESKFADFDYHIMVVTGDESWGDETCTHVCPNLGCAIGEPCCPISTQGPLGSSCCGIPEYPCQDLDIVTKCDRKWGAGEVFPAGFDTQNKPCSIDGDLRYLVKGQSNLEETFKCIATVGTSGYALQGQALTAAMQDPINQPGGCNRGFLRKDALLMVTLISSIADMKPQASSGTPAEWAQAVIDAKHGDAKSVVVFNIGGCGDDNQCLLIEEQECYFYDRVCQMTTMFPYHLHENFLVPDYGPAFAKAAGLVETACVGFTPPPG